MADFVIPELGENVTAGDVVRVMVNPGDAVKKDQPVLELETDKATIEVPSSVQGTVTEVKVKPGDKVQVGQSVMTVDDAAAASAASTEKAGDQDEKPAQPEAPVEAPQGEAAAPDEPKDEQEQEQKQEHEKEQKQEQKQEKEPASSGGKVVDIGRGQPRPAALAPVSSGGGQVPAAPSTRRYARELGIEVASVPGSGPGGRISADDVKAQARALIAGGGPRGFAGPLPDFSQWGETERQPLRAVRRKTAEHMANTWATVPHVTQFDKADITDLERLRQRYGKKVEQAGGKLTVTAIALKVIAAALKTFPQFNSSLDASAEELILKKYIHIGVAVDTDRGLLVPVIRDVDRKSITELSVELAGIAEKAKAGKLSPGEMQGGSFTISNLGGLGGTYFTPIVNMPEVAILGLSRSTTEPVWMEGEFQPRLMMPLSLSYDHRVIDGADGIRFLRWVSEAFEQPFLMSLEG